MGGAGANRIFCGCPRDFTSAISVNLLKPASEAQLKGGTMPSSDLIAFILWNAVVFVVGFAAGWIAKRRAVRKKAKGIGTLY